MPSADKETVGLQRNVPFTFSHDETYTNSNRSIADAAWNAPKLHSWVGLVALSKDYIESQKLLPAQRWPWDESRSLYILNGFHNLHCLVSFANASMLSDFFLTHLL